MSKNTDKNLFITKSINEEPWVELCDSKALMNWEHEDRISYNQRNRHIEKFIFFQKVFDFLTDNKITGNYFEFGIHRCRTFRMVLSEARKHNIKDMKFFAFDSFEGLPERHAEDDSIDKWKKGALTTSENDFMSMVKEHGLYLSNIFLEKGFYEDRLKKELVSKYKKEHNYASLVNIDCDFYSSAVSVFNFIDELLIEGSVIYIDDMFAGYKGQRNKGVARAFYEYEKSSKWSFEKYLDIGWFGRSFIVQSKN